MNRALPLATIAAVVLGCSVASEASAPDSSPAGSPDLAEAGANFPALGPADLAGELPSCPVLTACAPPIHPWSPETLLETPEDIELREMRGLRALAFNRTTGSFVVYELAVDRDRLLPPSVTELGPRFDHVSLASNGLLGCSSGACVLVTPSGELPVPVELGANAVTVTSSADCVGGAGLACLEGLDHGWEWIVRPDELGDPIERFTRLPDRSFIATGPGARLRRLTTGRARDIPPESTDRLVGLDRFPHVHGTIGWLGWTERGDVVVGNAIGARSCPAQVQGAAASATTMAFVVEGAILETFERTNTCYALPLAPDVPRRGVTIETCGLASNPFAWDAHRIVGNRSLLCAFD